MRAVADRMVSGGPVAHPRALAVVVALLTVFGPISLDLYLPVLPALTADLHAATSTALLTITACLVGLAVGQLVAGPVSDRFGRRPPALVWVAAYVVTSLLCALAPTVEVLTAARLLQGAAGSGGIVIAQAIGRDLYSGPKLTRYYGRLAVLGGLAAIIGPVLGGQLAALTDWRGIFVFLALIGALIFIACALLLTETHARGARTTGGAGHALAAYRGLLLDGRLVAIVLVVGFVSAALFAYLSGATFVLQDVYGLSPQAYSLAFALNSAGFMVFGFLSGRLSGVLGEVRIFGAGLLLSLLGAVTILIAGLAHLPVVAIVLGLLALTSGVATTSPPSSALALRDHARVAGTAAALLGMSRYLFGGIAAPLVGLGSAITVSLGVVLVTGTAAAGAVFVLGGARRAGHVPDQHA